MTVLSNASLASIFIQQHPECLLQNGQLVALSFGFASRRRCSTISSNICIFYFCRLVYACTPHGSVMFFWPLFRTTASIYNLFRIFMLIFNFTWCLNHDKLSNIQRIRIQEAWKKWTKKRDGELHSALSVPWRIARWASVARVDRWLRLRISYSL